MDGPDRRVDAWAGRTDGPRGRRRLQVESLSGRADTSYVARKAASRCEEERRKLARREEAWPKALVRGDAAKAGLAVLAGAVAAKREVRLVEAEPDEASVRR
uniref:Uncharacterized protein n=1 Tax=Oryza glumipatula TaxID=40148 RepID=A0A0E0A860_9ORYZ